MRTRLGKPSPLGATWDGAGVDFAIYSERATGVELGLFDGLFRMRALRDRAP